MLVALAPVVILLGLGVGTVVASRMARTNPVVGYIVLGLALKSFGIDGAFPQGAIEIIAQLGVVFLLFDVGLHFSLHNVKEQAGDISLVSFDGRIILRRFPAIGHAIIAYDTYAAGSRLLRKLDH